MHISWIFPTSRRGWFWLVLRMVFLVVIPIAVLLRVMMHMPGQSYQGALAPLTPDEQQLSARMKEHIAAIASVEHNTRHPEALEAAARYIETQLTAMGYAVAPQQYESGDGPVRNIEVEIKGKGQAREIVVVGAHYDSARGAPGANDNGSGVAMVLELARSLQASKPARTLRFVLFANEEPPYFGTPAMGSRVYADRSHARGENIVAMLSLETIGHYDDAPGSQQYPAIFKPFFPDAGNFIGFIGDLRSRDLVQRSVGVFRAAENFPSEGIATFPWIIGIDWSDHAAFWRNDYRALMITDTAPFRYPYYHTAQDKPERVNTARMAQVFQGVRAVVTDLATRS